MSDWGQGAKNNNIGWGQGAVNNNISWGFVHADSWAGDTDIVGENAIAPVNTIAPVVSGTNTVGSILTTTNGSWSGSLPITYTYQWLRNGSNISGATSSTYTLVTADTSNVVSCRVTATNSVGSANATSNSLTIYEAEYKAILDYATTNSYTLPTPAQRLKQNTLLSSLKTAGVWNKLDTFANFATDGSAQFALIDWKRLVQYNASTGPTFITNEGFTGNGTSSYINTNFNPTIGTNNYKVADASRCIYVRTQGVSQSLDGVSTGNVNCFVASSSSTPSTSISLFRINQGSNAPIWAGGAVNSNASNQMKSIHRTSSTASRVYLGTTSYDFTNLAGVNALVSLDQLILQRNGVFGDSQISMYSMGANLVAENTAYVNAYNTYINSL